MQKNIILTAITIVTFFLCACASKPTPVEPTTTTSTTTTTTTTTTIKPVGFRYKVPDDMRESPNEARRLDYDNLLVEKDTNVMDTMLLIAIRHTDDFSSISLKDFAQLDQDMMKQQVKVTYDGTWIPEGFTEKNIDYKAYQFSYKVGRDRIFQRSVYLRDRQRYYIISMSSKFGKLQVIDDENNFFWDNVEVD